MWDRRPRWALLFAVACSCGYEVRYDDCRVTCTAASGCPDGLTCGAEGRCRAAGATGSCVAIVDTDGGGGEIDGGNSDIDGSGGGVDGSSGVCGDGEVGGIEQCDEGAMNGLVSSCCTGTCMFVAATEACRPAAGDCDVAESCTGSSGACPVDVTVDDGMPCTGNGVGACTLADRCAGGMCTDNDLAPGASCAATACDVALCGADQTCAAPGAQTVAIIESQSSGSLFTQDASWRSIAQGLGYTATIYPQTHLDNLSNLSSATILVVSSSRIMLPQARRDVIAEFLASGRGVYIQGEYLATYEGNAVFEAIADANGAIFNWGMMYGGAIPVAAVGCYATTPNAVASSQQSYAVTGFAAGPGLSAVQINQNNNAPVAFAFCRDGGGLMITKTDGDDIRTLEAPTQALMRNILHRLTGSSGCTQ